MVAAALLSAMWLLQTAQASSLATHLGATERRCQVIGVLEGEVVNVFTPSPRLVPHEQRVVARDGFVSWLSEGDTEQFFVVERSARVAVPAGGASECSVTLTPAEPVDGTVVGWNRQPVATACVEVCGAAVFADVWGAFRVWVPMDSTCEVAIFSHDVKPASLTTKETVSTPEARAVGLLVMRQVPPSEGSPRVDDLGALLAEEVRWSKLNLAHARARGADADPEFVQALAAWHPAKVVHKACLVPR